MAWDNFYDYSMNLWFLITIINKKRLMAVCSLKKNGKLKDKSGKDISIEKVWEWTIKLEKSVTWDSVMLCVEQNAEMFDILTSSVIKDCKASDVVKEWREYKDKEVQCTNIESLSVRWVADIHKMNGVKFFDPIVYLCGIPNNDSPVPESVSFHSPAALSGFPIKIENKIKFYENIMSNTPTSIFTMQMKARDFFNAVLSDITFYGLGFDRESRKVSFENLKREVRAQMDRLDRRIEQDENEDDFFLDE